VSETPRRRHPTIADVAAEAGVSVPTVSRVLNGTAKVSLDKQTRVRAAVAALDFRPNAAARALVGGAHAMVAVIAGNTTRLGYSLTIQGVEEAARRAGHVVVISVVEAADPVTVRAAVDLALSQPLAGAVVLEYDPAGIAALQALPSWLPVVAVAAGGPTWESMPHATMDDRVGASKATRYLLDLGHRTVHHVAIPSAGRVSSRLVGWRDALVAAGAPVPQVVQAGWSPVSGYDAGRHLASLPDVTAVLCGNDELAMGTIRALQDTGRRVPEDISVVGFDDHPLGQLWTPSLTTVRQDFVQLGREAFDMLQQVQSGEAPPTSTRLVPDLVVRSSSGRAPLQSS
jgi:DNA-binding LacI/PurR family transcriptional regulator